MKKSFKCIITGGAGFIGSHLCEALLEKQAEVYCIDNLATGSADNIDHLLSNPDFHFIRHDVVFPFSADIQKNLANPQFIYHLASPASPPFYKKLSIETLMVNSLGTKNMLDLACKYRSAFLFTSTSEVYGNPLVHPQKEDYFGNVNPIGVRACYDEAKRFGEALVMEYIRKFNVDARIVRIFNTYGPRMQADDGRVIVNFINQAIRNRPVTMYGDGSFTRSFCYVSDMVKGIIMAMENTKARHEVINLGFPREHTILEIARLIIKETGSGSVIKKGPRQEDDPTRRKPDITKATRLLKWSPVVPLTEGIKQTIGYFQKL